MTQGIWGKRSVTVTVGLLTVEIFEGETYSTVIIGGGEHLITIDVVSHAAQRMFDELTRIRAALLAANAVLHDDSAPGPVTRSEVHLANLLLDLDISGSTP